MPHSVSTLGLRVLLLAIPVLTGIAGLVPPAGAEVYHSKESALELAFGTEALVEDHELFLDQQEKARVEELAGCELESRLVRTYEGRRGEELLGYVYFETHRVRTLPETLMVVVRPDGSVDGIHLLAFHEPEVYLPHERFLHQFEGEQLDSELTLRTGLSGMAGSTFTARAVTAAVRRVLAVHEIKIRELLANAPAEATEDRID